MYPRSGVFVLGEHATVPFLRLRNAFKDRVFEASELVSTKTLFL